MYIQPSNPFYYEDPHRYTKLIFSILKDREGVFGRLQASDKKLRNLAKLENNDTQNLTEFAKSKLETIASFYVPNRSSEIVFHA